MRTAGRVLVAGIAMLAVGIVSGCGERSQVVEYKQGKYQGKADTQPWSNAPYSGDKARWEGDLKARNLQQDESRRTGG